MAAQNNPFAAQAAGDPFDQLNTAAAAGGSDPFENLNPFEAAQLMSSRHRERSRTLPSLGVDGQATAAQRPVP